MTWGKMKFVFNGCVMHFIDHCATEFFPSIVRTLSSCLFALRRSSCFQSHPLINDHTEQHTNGILNSNTYKSKVYTYVLLFYNVHDKIIEDKFNFSSSHSQKILKSCLQSCPTINDHKEHSKNKITHSQTYSRFGILTIQYLRSKQSKVKVQVLNPGPTFWS